MLDILRRFGATLRPHTVKLLMGCALILLTAAFELAQPWPLKVIVDNVLQGQPLTGRLGGLLRGLQGHPYILLTVSASAMMLLSVLAALGTYLSSRLLLSVGERIIDDLRTQIFAHLQRLSLSFHDRQRVGDLTNRLTGDVNAIQALLVAVFSTLAPNIALLLGILTVAVFVEPLFAILLLAVAPGFYFVVRYYRDSIKRASVETRVHEGRVASHVTETLSSIRLVQSFAAERRSMERFRGHSAARLDAALRQVDLQSRMPTAIELLAQGGRAAVLFVGAILVLRGQLSLGVLMVLLSYLQQVYSPMKALARMSSTVSKAQAGAERVDEVLKSTKMIVEHKGAVPAPPLRGEIEFRNVWFGYEPDRPVLRDVSLRAQPGQMIALAGLSGAGKSTIASLVPRLYDVEAGSVRLDGRDVREYTIDSVRSQVGMVLQNPLVVAGTLLDNIAFGAPHATRRELLDAGRAAHIDEFAMRLPDGYDTPIAEAGVSLSGGQLQRISIARALAADTPIVVLDEPTSGLDPISESLVMEGLSRLTAGRTVLVIAHRLSTLRNADQIYVIEDGRIIDRGTHAELSARPGRYQEMSHIYAVS